MESLRVAVREYTRHAHWRLEDALALTDRPCTMARYRLLLSAFAGFYGPLEARLAAFPQWRHVGIDYAKRRKLPWLIADLMALGATPSTLRTLPRCSDLPSSDTFERAVGCAYVLEGATIGGRRIRSILEPQLALSPECGARFFHSYGDELGAMWRQFETAMPRAANTPEQRRRLLEAADQTFAAMHRWVCSIEGLVERAHSTC